MRTKSMQPMPSTNMAQFSSKKALSRTKSLNPNLERQQQQANLWTPMQNHFLEPDRGSVTSVWSQPSNMVMLNPPKSIVGEAGSLTGFSVDVSRPPPMAPHQWGAPGENNGNAHRKLARQLTLNPTYDPRIPVTSGRFIGESATDPFSHPPPSLVGNFNQHQHLFVKRNASAPEPSSQQQHQHQHQQQQHHHQQQQLSRSPAPNVVKIEGELSDLFSVMHLPHHLTMQQQQQQHQQQQSFGAHPRRPLQLPHQISSDLKLCKSKSE